MIRSIQALGRRVACRRRSGSSTAPCRAVEFPAPGRGDSGGVCAARRGGERGGLALDEPAGPVPGHEQRRPAPRDRQGVALVGTEDVQRGRAGVGETAPFRDDAHRQRPVGDRTAGARVDGMRHPGAVQIVVVAVVAGRGDRGVGQGHDALRLRARDRPLHGDPPRPAPLGAARGPELAADLHQVVAEPLLGEPRRHGVDGVPLGDRRQIERHVRAPLPQRRGGEIDLQQAGADPRAERGQARRARRGRRAAWRPEAPGVHQRPHGHVERAAARPADGQGLGDDLQGLGRHGPRFDGPRPVETRELRIGTVVGHPPLDPLEDPPHLRFDGGPPRPAAGVGAGDDGHAVGRAHRRAGDRPAAADFSGFRRRRLRASRREQREEGPSGGAPPPSPAAHDPPYPKSSNRMLSRSTPRSSSMSMHAFSISGGPQR